MRPEEWRRQVELAMPADLGEGMTGAFIPRSETDHQALLHVHHEATVASAVDDEREELRVDLFSHPHPEQIQALAGQARSECGGLHQNGMCPILEAPSLSGHGNSVALSRDESVEVRIGS